MRRFGTDKPEFFSFQLGDSDEVYKIPLAASMPNSVLLKMDEAGDGSYKMQLDMLRQYIGDIVDDLTPGTTRDILLAWQEESAKQGAEPGES